MTLEAFSEEELRKELKKREIDRLTKPQVLPVIAWRPLIDICKNYIDCLGTGKQRDDGRCYIYEAAITAIYGVKAWDYVNKF